MSSSTRKEQRWACRSFKFHSWSLCTSTATSIGWPRPIADANQKSQSGDIWLEMYSPCGAATMACFSRQMLDVPPWCNTQASIAKESTSANRIFCCPSNAIGPLLTMFFWSTARSCWLLSWMDCAQRSVSCHVTCLLDFGHRKALTNFNYIWGMLQGQLLMTSDSD